MFYFPDHFPTLHSETVITGPYLCDRKTKTLLYCLAALSTEAGTDAKWLRGEQSAFFLMLAFFLPLGSKQHCLKTRGCFSFLKRNVAPQAALLTSCSLRSLLQLFEVFTYSLQCCVWHTKWADLSRADCFWEKECIFKSMFEIVVKTYQYLAMLKWEGWMVLWSACQILLKNLILLVKNGKEWIKSLVRICSCTLKEDSTFTEAKGYFSTEKLH